MIYPCMLDMVWYAGSGNGNILTQEDDPEEWKALEEDAPVEEED
jgi:hypothetical protein